MTSIRTYLKSHPHKRQKIEPVTLIPITSIELKVKQENKTYTTFKKILDSGASSTLITTKAVRHVKKHMQENQFQLRGRKFFPVVNVTCVSKWPNIIQQP